jgi:protein-S-isoprenylcysteine O-methyltransferase Ste14
MKKNLYIRIFIIIAAIVSIALFHADFYNQFNCYLRGQANAITAEWHIVALNILLFVFLLLPLSFKRKAKWGEYGMITAFFVSLFVEMYGFPLTLYFASRYFTEPVKCAEPIINFDFWGVGFGMELAMVYAAVLITIGTVLIGVGWYTLYKHKNEPFVARGIYKYSRHPQYLGFILIIFGWLIDWPTIITLIFVPILIYKYAMAGKVEEKELLKEYPEYRKYIEEVPYLI